MNENSVNHSRRVFAKRALAYILSVGVFLGINSNLSAAQGKLEQSAVQYQDTPKGSQQCDKCSLFQPPDACKSVSGKISPHGWCAIYTPKD